MTHDTKPLHQELSTPAMAYCCAIHADKLECGVAIELTLICKHRAKLTRLMLNLAHRQPYYSTEIFSWKLQCDQPWVGIHHFV